MVYSIDNITSDILLHNITSDIILHNITSDIDNTEKNLCIANLNVIT